MSASPSDYGQPSHETIWHHDHTPIVDPPLLLSDAEAMRCWHEFQQTREVLQHLGIWPTAQITKEGEQ